MKFKQHFFVQICVLSIILTGYLPMCCGVIQTIKLIDVARLGLQFFQVIITGTSNIKKLDDQRVVINSLNELMESSARIEHLLETEFDRVIEEITSNMEMKLLVTNYRDTIRRVNRRFEDEFQKYFFTNNTIPNEIMEDYIGKMIASEGFITMLEQIHDDIVPTALIPSAEENKLFEALHKHYEIMDKHSPYCGIGKSAYQLLFETYNLALLTLSKGYTMIAHAYKYRQQDAADPSVWNSKLQDIETKYKRSVFHIAEAARRVMATENRAIYSCDPRIYIEGENYKSYNFLTLFIPWNNPFGLLTDEYMKSHLASGSRSEAFCDGTRNNCQDSNIIQACLAPTKSTRRYECIIEQGKLFDWSWYYKGRQSSNCIRDALVYQDRNSKYQTCLCDEPYSQQKGALLNMTAQVTDFAKNRVITGVRFITKWSITYIEIQEGTLVNGTIDPATVHWNEEVTKMLTDYEERNLALPNDFYRNKYNIDTNHIAQNPYNDENIIDLSKRGISFNLDDIILPAGMVVTGVKFVLKDLNHISLRVQGSQMFDLLGDAEAVTDVKWYSVLESRGHEGPRLKIPLKKPDCPLYHTKPNREVKHSYADYYIDFHLSDWNKDACQSLIPFVDLQEVVTKPPAPLGGLGIFYKAQDGYGGFLSLKLISIDTTIFMSNEYYVLKKMSENPQLIFDPKYMKVFKKILEQKNNNSISE